MGHDVFVSHAGGDKPYADAAVAALEGRGIRCWVAPRDVTPGLSYMESISSALEQASIVVLVFTSAANQSDHVRREIQQAVESGKPVLPLRIEGVRPAGPLSYALAGTHWLDALTPPLEQHLQALASAVEALLERRGPRNDHAPVEEHGGLASGLGSGMAPPFTGHDAPSVVPPQPVAWAPTSGGWPPTQQTYPARPLPRWRQRPPWRLLWLLWTLWPILSLGLLGWAPLAVSAIRRPTLAWISMAVASALSTIAFVSLILASESDPSGMADLGALAAWAFQIILNPFAARRWTNEWWADAERGVNTVAKASG